MSHWTEAYIGRTYGQGEGEVDCAVLAETVSAEIFGRRITLPKARAGGAFGLSAQIQAAVADFADPTAAPVDGDGVLLVARGRLSHIGIYVRIGAEPYVLHALKSAGQVMLHRIRDLPAIGLVLEGYYRWR